MSEGKLKIQNDFTFITNFAPSKHLAVFSMLRSNYLIYEPNPFDDFFLINVMKAREKRSDETKNNQLNLLNDPPPSVVPIDCTILLSILRLICITCC